MSRRANTPDAFWRRVDQSGGPDACWPWTGPPGDDGYGQVAFQGAKWRAHRLAYTLARGPIPTGFTIDHDCHNRERPTCTLSDACPHRLCCNPAHLEAMTAGENARRSPNHAPRTHCPAGHEYRPENAWRDSKGRWWCRACRKARRERARARRTG